MKTTNYIIKRDKSSIISFPFTSKNPHYILSKKEFFGENFLIKKNNTIYQRLISIRIKINFKNKNKDILSRRKGNGYWLWKPYFILKTLKDKLNKGDYLIYTDSGIMYLDKVEKIINFMISKNEDIWAIRTGYIEKRYTKRDAFILLDADSPIYVDTYQYMAGIQIYKKSNFSEDFVERLLNYSIDKRIITDDPNTLGLPNYEGFIGNRHDQTVLSLLTKKFRYSHLNKNKTKASDLNKINVNLMPNIFCIYRRSKFKS